MRKTARGRLALLSVAVLLTAVVAMCVGVSMAGAATPTVIFTTGFEGGDVSGWNLGSSNPSVLTTWGETQRTSAHGGTWSIWCAARNNVGSQYVNNMNAYATHDITLTADYTSPVLSFWYKIPATGLYSQTGDFGVLDVYNGNTSTWETAILLFALDEYTTPVNWQKVELSLSDYLPTSGSSTSKVRWRWISDGDSVGEGMYVDDVAVSGIYGGPDLTPPSTPVVLRDSAVTTNLTELHALWSAEDTESGIAKYECSVGTSAGATDTVDWIDAGTSTEGTINIPGGLTPGTDYYVNVRATNGASPPLSSTGSSSPITAKGTSVISIDPTSVVVVYGAKVAFEGTISPTPAEGTTVTVYARPYPYTGSAVKVGEATTTADGSYSAAIASAPTQNTRYFARWDGNATHIGADSLNAQVNVRVKLAISRSRATVYRWRRQTQGFLGTVRPSHTGRAVFYIYRSSGGRWVTVRAISVALHPYGSYSYARCYYRPVLAGSYKARVRYAGDATHMANYSSYVTFRVR